MQTNVKVKKLVPDAIKPEYQSSGASGFDIHAYTEGERINLQPFERKLIRTGLAFAVPEGQELQLRPRSGLAYKYGITLTNTPATIDSDYRGEVKVLLHNLGNEVFTIEDGDRIAQGVIVPIKQVNLEVVDDLDETERGSGGFGHTGK